MWVNNKVAVMSKVTGALDTHGALMEDGKYQVQTTKRIQGKCLSVILHLNYRFSGSGE